MRKFKTKNSKPNSVSDLENENKTSPNVSNKLRTNNKNKININKKKHNSASNFLGSKPQKFSFF